MKRIGAVCMTASRQLLPKLLLLAAVMAGVEWLLFSSVSVGLEVTFGDRLEKAKIPLIFGAAIVIFSLIAVLHDGQFFGGKNGYTLQRLPIGEAAVSLLWAGVYLSCFVILWAVQLIMVFSCWRIYCGSHPVPFPSLELFVEFYAEPFLHTLLPLADLSRWLRMVLWGLSVSFSLAAFGYCHRRGKFRLEALVLLAVGMPSFGADLGNLTAEIALMVFSATMAFSSAYGMWRMKHEEN